MAPPPGWETAAWGGWGGDLEKLLLNRIYGISASFQLEPPKVPCRAASWRDEGEYRARFYCGRSVLVGRLLLYCGPPPGAPRQASPCDAAPASLV